MTTAPGPSLTNASAPLTTPSWLASSARLNVTPAPAAVPLAILGCVKNPLSAPCPLTRLSMRTSSYVPAKRLLPVENVARPLAYHSRPATFSVNADVMLRLLKSALKLATPSVPVFPSVSVGLVLPMSVYVAVPVCGRIGAAPNSLPSIQ